MKLIEFNNIEDYDLKLVEITNLSSKVKTSFKRRFKISEPVLGILYIDYNHGLTIELIGDNNTIIDKTTIVRGEVLEESEFNAIDDKKLYSKYKDRTERIKLEFYDNNKILKLRKDSRLNKFRDRLCPDDVECILYTEGKGMERVYVKVLLKARNASVYAGYLVEDAKLNKYYKKNTEVAFDYSERLNSLIILGKTQKELEEDIEVII